MENVFLVVLLLLSPLAIFANKPIQCQDELEGIDTFWPADMVPHPTNPTDHSKPKEKEMS